MKRISPFMKLTIALVMFCAVLLLIRVLQPGQPISQRTTQTNADTTEQKPSKVILRGTTLGTTFAITIEGLSDALRLPEIESTIKQRLVDINQIMSTYIPASEISQFNRSQTTAWYNVSKELLGIVQLAQSISEQSQGAFDITVGPAVNLWKFGPQTEENTTEPNGIPTADDVAQVLKHIGYQQLHLRENPPGLKKDDPQLQIDLSAIAKGYAVDQVTELLEALQLDMQYMVEIGGEIRTVSFAKNRNNRRTWRLGIQDPSGEAGTTKRIVAVKSQAIATSGDYVNYYEIEGVRYSHTIDPSTAMPVQHPLASTVVITDTCAAADAWATALLVLGPKRAYDIANKHDQPFAVLLITRINDQLEWTPNRAMKLFLE
ncbi:MAG: FAD:protein FMN transferase [Pirellulaceae bacterium]|nr:FAD:protein FMN transferase [Pirellulaceae bacterium]